ncbi:hypothetical protein GOBAR_DD25965 [Gossypium barbadense]|nr:hypothetical protein GOBAR_DD25965 [Gossypium barbadense]
MAMRGLVISNFEEGYEAENYCEFHHEVGHEIQKCEGFKALVQSMMDNKEMRFYEKTEGNRVPVPKISRTTEMGLQLMIGSWAAPGKRLGKYLQGKIEAPMLKEKFDSYGLGYKPDLKQKKKEVEKRQREKKVTFKQKRGEDIGEMLENVHINAIETSEKRASLDICPYEPGSELNNWTTEEIPVVFKAYSE